MLLFALHLLWFHLYHLLNVSSPNDEFTHPHMELNFFGSLSSSSFIPNSIRGLFLNHSFSDLPYLIYAPSLFFLLSHQLVNVPNLVSLQRVLKTDQGSVGVCDFKGIAFVPEGISLYFPLLVVKGSTCQP